MAQDNSTSKEDRIKALRARLDQMSQEFSRKKGDKLFAADEIRAAIRREKSPRGKPAESQPIIYHRDLPRTDPHGLLYGAEQGGGISLEEAVPGEEVHTERGKAFLVSARVDDLDEAALFSRNFEERISPEDSAFCQRVAATVDPQKLALDDLIFVDIETTGLSSSPLFLIGTMIWETDGFEVRQFLARNYAEEAAVISLFLETCLPRKLLVTFNGKSFDFPYIRTRAAANGIPFDLAPAHFDLLHECRRIWKDVLPDCKLQTLETHVCKRPRYGDIPGSQIPDAYHAYVRTENAHQIAEILRHNMLDLITLADLMARFPKP
ncbi:MAG: ribonuclease H-like domain-containing protein [Candidatus Latescibacterota bacterium]